MCGIAGRYNFDGRPVEREQLRRMTDRLAHRGPDDSGLHLDGPLGLGHRRLAILDLSAAGHQPMASEAGTVWISYNGECYNHLALRPALAARGHRFRSNSDTETLLALYDEHGIDFLSRLAGMFAIALWDSRTRQLLLARDRLGIKPLYYHQDGRRLIFASELKSLLVDPDLPTTLNDRALSDYLHLMSITDPETIFAGVRRVRPGHYLVVSNGTVREVAWWELPVTEPPVEADFTTASRDFNERFQAIVADHLLSDVPVGAFLSGGVDSSAVVAAMRHETASPILTFSSTFRGQPDFDESARAGAIARQFQTEHHEIELTPRLREALPRIAWHADEPFAISSAFALYFLAEETSRQARVVLTGDGGDEVFAGYPWRHLDYATIPDQIPAPLRRITQALSRALLPDRAAEDSPIWGRLRAWINPGERYARALSAFRPAELTALLTPEMGQKMRRAWAENLIERYFDRYQQVDQLTRKLYADLKTTLVSEMLTKVDRMTMAFGLEARVPFLDHRLVEWAFRLPAQYKMREGLGKAVVRKALEKHLPHDLLYAPKHGFNVPMKSWLEGPLREFVRDNLAESAIRRRGLFQPAAVTALLQPAAIQNQESAADRSNQILTLLMLELWFQQFIDQRR